MLRSSNDRASLPAGRARSPYAATVRLRRGRSEHQRFRLEAHDFRRIETLAGCLALRQRLRKHTDGFLAVAGVDQPFACCARTKGW
jgi:hypothetical protein